MQSLQVNVDGVKHEIEVGEIPKACTMCHCHIHPHLHGTPYLNSRKEVYVTYVCPNCGELLIATYTRGMVMVTLYKLFLQKVGPIKFKQHDFNQEIMDLSPRFSDIYNESLKAESDGLLEICGPGYRKALEILLKDYLIQHAQEEQDDIKKRPLGNCINQINNAQIQACAKRATWLGNDETHYVRKWENKDLSDLKTLIRLVVNFIESEVLAARYQEEMPEPQR